MPYNAGASGHSRVYIHFARSESIVLLKLLSWIRRRSGAMAVFRVLPSALRARIADRLARADTRSLKFPKSRQWRGRVVAEDTRSDAGCPGTAPPGVNIFSFVKGRFGLAESARQYTRALIKAGCPVTLHDIGERLPISHDMGDESLVPLIGRGPRHSVNLVFVNPDYFDVVTRLHAPEVSHARYTIACWFWEVENFPLEWLPTLDRVDEIMVASRHMESALRKVTDKPVLRVPIPICDPRDSGLQRRDFGLREDAFVFLNAFDFNSYQQRKNPQGAIRAFREAFPDDEFDVQLLLKTSNGHRNPAALRALLATAGEDERIIVRDEIIERSHLRALQRCADSFVSLHRAEGFGMALAECMSLGKPVVATAWSGNMEFMSPSNSCLVRSRLVDIEQGEYAHSIGQRWAEPDIGHASELMRRLVADPAHARQLGMRARLDVAARLSAGVAAEKIMSRIQEITAGLGPRQTSVAAEPKSTGYEK